MSLSTPKINYITEYNNKLQSGEIKASKRIRAVYGRLAAEIANPIDGYIFDPDKAQRPIDFIEKFCRHSKGEWAGKRIKLELFQKAFISALFGFVDALTGFRRYREAFLLMGRKNAKTTLLAAIALYMLMADGEAGAEVYSLASKKDQAAILYSVADNMRLLSPALAKRIKRRKSDLYCTATFSKMQALGKNTNTLDGVNCHLCVIDECHSIRDINTYSVMKQSQTARQQPLMLIITTAGTVRESLYDTLYDYAAKVADGTLEDLTYMPALYELDDKGELKDESCWIKANPALGVSKSLTELRQNVKRAQNDPSFMPSVLCKDFNLPQNSAEYWLTYEQFNNTETFDLEIMRGKWAIGGVDLSITTDLTCASLLYYDPETTKKYVHQMYWTTADTLTKRGPEERQKYELWISQGYMRVCAGNSIDSSDVVAWFDEMLNERGISPFYTCYDSYSSKAFVNEMKNHGYRIERTIQGFKTLSIPMEQLGLDLAAHNVIYNNNPVLKWCLSNVCLVTDRNGNLMPQKSRNPAQRIDGAATLLDCYSGLLNHLDELKEG